MIPVVNNLRVRRRKRKRWPEFDKAFPSSSGGTPVYTDVASLLLEDSEFLLLEDNTQFYLETS